jgi:hypothetical protein
MAPMAGMAGAQQVTDPMPLFWLCYRHDNHISVVIEPGHPSFMQGYGQRLMDWMKASSPKATSLIASGR